MQGYVFMCSAITVLSCLAIYDIEKVFRDQDVNYNLWEKLLFFSYIIIFVGFQMVGWFPSNCHVSFSTAYHSVGILISVGVGLVTTIVVIIVSIIRKNYLFQWWSRKHLHIPFWVAYMGILIAFIVFYIRSANETDDVFYYATGSVIFEFLALQGHFLNTIWFLRNSIVAVDDKYNTQRDEYQSIDGNINSI